MNFSVLTTYEVIACYKCGVLFAVPDDVHDELHRTGRTFYCPNGHGQVYTDSTVAQLQKERDRNARLVSMLDQTRADRDAVERSRRAVKGQLTRVKRRVANGVCPCCNRTFPDLAAHMHTKHPEYVGDVPAPEPPNRLT